MMTTVDSGVMKAAVGRLVRHRIALLEGRVGGKHNEQQRVAANDAYNEAYTNVRNVLGGPIISDEEQWFLDQAEALTNDELELDENAVVSMSSDPGAWVQMWHWIPRGGDE
jgi:hypothetical protein